MRARAIGMVLLVWLPAACAKGTDDWIVDLKAEERFTREMAATALRDASLEELGRVVPALLRTNTDEPEVKARADESLDALVSKAPAVFARLLVDPRHTRHRDYVASLLTRLGDAARAPLEDVLRGGGANRHVAIALGRIGESAVPALASWGEDGDLDHLALAIAGLQIAGEAGPEAIRPLGPRLVEAFANAPEQQAVADTIETACRDSAVAAWLVIEGAASLPQDQSYELTGIAIRGLVLGLRLDTKRGEHADQVLMHLAGRAVPHLIDALDDERAALRKYSAVTLVGLGPDALRTMLEVGVEDRWLTKVAEGLAEPGTAVLREAAQGDDEALRERATRILKQL